MKYLRRMIWYAASRLMVVCVVLGILVTVFYYAMNLTNVYIVLKDGMARRAQVVMMEEDASELNKYFQSSFLERDPALQALQQGNSPYQDYNIRGIDHRLSISFMWVWPWDNTCRVDITERIPAIDGRIKGSKAEAAIAAYGDGVISPPDWQAACYRAVLAKENGQWRIKSLTLLETLNED